MKVVINRCYGGFSVSELVFEKLGVEYDGYGYIDTELGYKEHDTEKIRSDPRLIAAIEAVGLEAASGRHASLTIVDIPDNIDWYIDEYDGIETVHEEHRSW